MKKIIIHQLNFADSNPTFIFLQNPINTISSSMANSLRRKSAVLDSMYYPIIGLLIVLIACVEFSDAVTAVDVYRLVQYDIAGVPFGSRLATLNHHAGSSFFGSGSSSDLSRTVLILPVRELNLTLITG